MSIESTTNRHELIQLAREFGGVPLIREPTNAVCGTMFRYKGCATWRRVPAMAARDYLLMYRKQLAGTDLLNFERRCDALLK